MLTRDRSFLTAKRASGTLVLGTAALFPKPPALEATAMSAP